MFPPCSAGGHAWAAVWKLIAGRNVQIGWKCVRCGKERGGVNLGRSESQS